MLLASSTALSVHASDFVLGIFGNANMDDDIDEKDIAYLEGVMKGTNPATNLSDANYDGKVDTADIDQIEKIMSGDENELTILQHVGYGNDLTDKIVTVTLPIERMIILNEDAAEGIRIVDAKEKIVGVSNFAEDDPDFWSDMSGIPIVSSDDYESIIALKPQVVLNYASFGYKPELEEALKPMGISTVSLDLFKPEFLICNIRTLGVILGKKENAEEFIDFLQENLSLIEKRVDHIDPKDKKRIFFESSVSSEYPDLSTGANGSAWNSQIISAGGINIFADANSPYPKISPEDVLKRNPDIVVRQVRQRGYSIDNPDDLIELRREMMDRPGWNELNAVKNNRIFIVTNGIAWCGIRKHIGIFYMAKWFYPELFSDIDPEEIHRVWLEKFEGMKYKGIWAYPKEAI
jgi:iron complex transport system substrate-binding protein